MKTLDLQEAAAMLKVHENTVLELVGSGEVPGAKIGRAWVFLDEDLLAYVRKQINQQSANRVAGRSGNLRKAA
jgi:excisionase family DNA binding protein